MERVPNEPDVAGPEQLDWSDAPRRIDSWDALDLERQREWWEAIPEDVRKILERYLQYAFPSDREDFPSKVARIVVPWAGWRHREGATEVLREAAERLNAHVRYLGEEGVVGGRYGGLYSPEELAILVPLEYYEFAHERVRRARLVDDVEFEAVRAMWKAFEKDLEPEPDSWRDRIRNYVSGLSKGGRKVEGFDAERDILATSGTEGGAADSGEDTGGSGAALNPLAADRSGGGAADDSPSAPPPSWRSRRERRWTREVQPIGSPRYTHLERAVSALCSDIQNAVLGSRDRREALADAAYLLIVDGERANDEGLRGLHGFDYGLDEWIRELSQFVQVNPNLKVAWRHACTLRGANPRALEVLLPHPITALEIRAVLEYYNEHLLTMADLEELPADLSLIEYNPNKMLVRVALYLGAFGYSPDRWTLPVIATLADWGFETDDDTEKFSTRLRVYMLRVRAKHEWLAEAAAELKRYHLN